MLLCQSVRTCYQINLISFNCLCSFGLLLAGGSVFGCIFFFCFFFRILHDWWWSDTKWESFPLPPIFPYPSNEEQNELHNFQSTSEFFPIFGWRLSFGFYEFCFFFLPPIMRLDKLLRPLCGGFNGLLRWQTHVGDGKTCWAFTRTSSDCVWGLNQWKSLFYLC